MPDRLNQVVAGEPSLGTLHHFPLNATTTRLVAFGATPAVGAWSAAKSCSAYVPAGTKAVLAKVGLYISSTAAGRAYEELAFSDNNSTTPTGQTAHPYVLPDFYAEGAARSFQQMGEYVIPLNTSLAFYLYSLIKSNVASENVDVILKGYYI